RLPRRASRLSREHFASHPPPPAPRAMLAACGYQAEETSVATLRPVTIDECGEGHDGEIYAVAYNPDGETLLTGGWDGCLRLWDAVSAAPLTALKAAPKPLSACAVTPDGQRWLSGSMEGVLAVWGSVTKQPVLEFLAHTRPISAICFTPDGGLMAT